MRRNRAFEVEMEDLDVVVVDDSKPMQTIIRSILSAARVARVRTFDNAEDAYRAMLVDPPHLALVDWNMPVIDGLSLVRLMHSDRSGPLVGVPVLLVTAHATRRLVARAIECGVHAVLVKPVSPAGILKRIDAIRADGRSFVGAADGTFALDDRDDLLARQSRSWRDAAMADGDGDTIDLPLQRRLRRQPRLVRPATPPAEEPELPPRPRLDGLGVPIRHEAGETSTGQPASRTA